MRRYPQFRSSPTLVAPMPSVGAAGAAPAAQTVVRRRRGQLSGSPSVAEMLVSVGASSGGSAIDLTIQDATHAHTADNITIGGLYTDLELILKILSNRQELNAGTGTFTIYDDDSVSVLFTANAWADAAGTVPYSGGTLGRIDALA